MKKTTILVLAVAASLLTATSACQQAANSNVQTNAQANNKNTNVPVAVNVTTPVPPATVATAAASSPTAAYEAAYAARKNKDVPGLKNLLSKDILEFFGEVAVDEKKSLDQVIKDLCDKPQAAAAQARNEKIDGEYATIEYLDENGKWKTMDFIKEGGGWKLTVPRFDKESLEVETKE